MRSKLMQCCSISSGLVYFRAVSMRIYFLLKHSPSVSDYFTQNNSPNHHRANVNLQQLLLVVDRVLLKKMALAHCKCNMSCFFIALLCTEISLTADIARVIEKLPLLNWQQELFLLWRFSARKHFLKTIAAGCCHESLAIYPQEQETSNRWCKSCFF